MAKAARKDKAVVPDGPLLTEEKDVNLAKLLAEEQAIFPEKFLIGSKSADFLVVDDVQDMPLPVTWSKEGPPPEGWKESSGKWDDWTSKFQAPAPSAITYKAVLEEQAKLATYKWHDATFKPEPKTKTWFGYGPGKTYPGTYDNIDTDIHVVAPSLVRDFFSGVLRVMGGFRLDMCDLCDKIQSECTCCSFCEQTAADCDCPICAAHGCDGKDAICDNCLKCADHCICLYCTSCEGIYSELTCGDCEHCEECGCTCGDGDSEGGEYGSTDVAPWCARGIEIVHAEIAAERNAYLDSPVDDERYVGSDAWRQIWPIDTTIDPTQSMAEFYLLDGIAGMVFNGDRLISRDPSLKVIAAEAQKMQDALVATLDDAFVKYVDMAIGGELRYHRCIGNRAQLGNSRHVAWMDWFFVRQKVGPQALLDAADLFREITRGGIGGDAWANGAELLHARLTGKLDPRTFVDRVFTLQHNGGNFINKIAWGRKNEPSWDISAMLSVIGPAHSQDPPVFGVLLAAAGRPVRQLFADWWRMTNRVRRLHALPQTEIPTLFTGATIAKDSYRQGRRSLTWRIPTFEPDGSKQDPVYWRVAQWVGNDTNPIENWRNFIVVGKIPFVEMTGMQWQFVQFIAEVAKEIKIKPVAGDSPVEELNPVKYLPSSGVEYDKSYTVKSPNRIFYVWCVHFVQQHGNDPRLPEVTTMDENEAGYCIAKWVPGEKWARYRRRWRDHLNRQRKKNGEQEEDDEPETSDEELTNYVYSPLKITMTPTSTVAFNESNATWATSNSSAPLPSVGELNLPQHVIDDMHYSLKQMYGGDYVSGCLCPACTDRRLAWLNDNGYDTTPLKEEPTW